MKDLKIINNSPDRGRGIYCDNTNTNISNIIIENNSSTVGGGGINIYGNSPIVSNIIVKDNSSRFGGAISIADYATPSLYNILIYNNEADDFGKNMLASNTTDVLKKLRRLVLLLFIIALNKIIIPDILVNTLINLEIYFHP